ncbi:MAG: dual specificity protein phosphatase family protein [Muribaculaceae bacterium]|nr:dual specificity protein phosphatase family protein [Muribaculaceae bacterium]
MKVYSFANIQARPRPTKSDLNNHWIFGATRCVINVSTQATEFEKEYEEKDISYYHFPLQENVSDIGIENLLSVVKVLLRNIKNNTPTIVHCSGGVNRSRSVVEATYYAIRHSHLQDEYKGCYNHLIWNIEHNFVPYSLPEVEKLLIALTSPT